MKDNVFFNLYNTTNMMDNVFFKLTYTEHILLIVAVMVGLSCVAYIFPIKDNTGSKNKSLSIFMILTLFPLYLILFATQNPFIGYDNKPNVYVSLFILIIFWPALFFINTESDDKIKTIDIV
jgi:peptidoglycan biosynthesis protein MviN/MurJ (putative lipid II flippase)